MSVQIEKREWGGWPNCYRISNGEIELIVTADIGPRVMRCGFVGGQNFFRVFDDQLGKSGEAEWQLRGGHRIWQKLVPGAQGQPHAVTRGAGHFLQEDKGAEVAAAMLAFMKATPLP